MYCEYTWKAAFDFVSDSRALQQKSNCIFLHWNLPCLPLLSGSRFQLWSGDKVLGDAVLENHFPSCYNCDQRRVRKMRGGWTDRRRRRRSGEETGSSGGLWKAVMRDYDPCWQLVRSVHRSPYCLLGGLSGRKQVSMQIASESNISETLFLCVIRWPSSTVTPHCPGRGPCDWDFCLMSSAQQRLCQIQRNSKIYQSENF